MLKRRAELDKLFPHWERKTIARHFDDQASQFSERVLVETLQERWTYRQILEEANRVARGLMTLGVKKRNHVALLMGNYVEFIIYKIAIAKIGAVCIPINTMSQQEDISFVLKNGDASVLVMNDRLNRQEYAEFLYNLYPEIRTSETCNRLNIETLPLLRHIITVSKTQTAYDGMISHEQLLQLADETTEMERVQRQEQSEFPEDVSDIIFTSGTTGDPKGVMLTHDNFLRCSYSSVYTRGYADGTKFVSGLPLYHVFAYTEGFLTSTFVGGTFIPQVQFNPRETFQLIETFRANVWLGVPSMCVALLNHADLPIFDLSSLYGVMCAAANAPIALWERCRNELKVTDVYTGYGMTEVSASSMMTMVGDSLETVATRIGTLKPSGAAGAKELNGYAAIYKVVDLETGEDLPPGKDGELVCRGPIVTKGYYKNPLETAKVIDKDGWLRTGDVGILHEDGYFEFTGRTKEMYKISGENVSPKSVEDVISKFPKVNQVHVVGIPDKHAGEVGAACIELKEGVECSRTEIIEYCRKHLAKYKIPRHILFIKVHELPMTSTGKIQKFKLAQFIQERLNLTDGV